MSGNLALEKEILEQKRKDILNEVEEKRKYQAEISKKLRILTKEAKGSYDQEKENTEKIYNLLKKEIENYEEALKNPYFGRVDFNEKFGVEENIYIGKKGITSTVDGEEIVVDWRAPVADLYYSGTGGEAYYKAPMGIVEGELNLKRKFLFNDDNLDKVFDESTNEIIINGEEGSELVDEFLKMNLEESRGKKLKEVVATIQREQNDIIRWPKNLPIIVQGSAGSGKTTIALHRLAYLLYRYRESMEGKDILVLAPNKLFLDYISDILPTLGSNDVKQTTFQELVMKILKLKGKIKTKDDKLKELIEIEDQKEKQFIVNSSRFKGNLIFKGIIDRYIALLESSSLEIDDILISDYILFSKREIMRLYLKDLQSYPINKRKDEIKRYLSLKLKERIESLIIQIDREWDIKIREVKRELNDGDLRRHKLIDIYNERDNLKEYIKHDAKKVMNEYFKNWRGVTCSDIYINLFKDDQVFEIATGNRIPEELAKYMKVEAISNYEKGIIDEDDLSVLLYIYMLLEGIDEKSKYKHIVVDEAQDYSPFQIYLVNSLSMGNSLTLVGDLAQGIYHYKGIRTWEDITDGVFEGKATFITLSQSYRSTVEIIEFANSALNAQGLGLKSAKPVLRHGEKPEVIKSVSRRESVRMIEEIVKRLNSKGKHSIAIITKTYSEGKVLEKELKKHTNLEFSLIKGNEKESPNTDIIIIPAYLTKGLEFDGTIIYNPTERNYPDNILNQRLLYVALTRALHSEYIIAEEELSKNINN
ncbi:RNA polymerase recycling motor HelD [uncultured Clostridium sp.]|uniref:RNA polymerase recycling motor HelD n=1 Tax=uncultured Clostridium sp. TaxID=59620 RepID=UPI0025DF2E1A|nr:RNA polymerase recycling motor HelD [uncultured Clostridium sp.]MDU4883294.1 RNA polymerase recycling motor HelD [Clostridium celatum]MDU7076359.1 RNA polymerase recycling motor HelD [Clostridium celatum]